MSFDSVEKSVHSGQPWECYWFSCGTLNWRYTNASRAITTQGFTFEPEAISITEVSQSQELNSGEITLSLPLDNAVASLFKGSRPPRPVSLVIFRGHFGDSEVVSPFSGVVASASHKDVTELKVITDQDGLKLSIPGLAYCSQCPHTLFDDACGLDAADYREAATLSYVSGTTIKSAAFATKPNGYFKAGWVEFGGMSMVVTAHSGDAITLMDSLAGLTVGSAVLAYPGCQGTEAYCEATFNNLVNCLAFSHIPGINPFGANGVG